LPIVPGAGVAGKEKGTPADPEHPHAPQPWAGAPRRKEKAPGGTTGGLVGLFHCPTAPQSSSGLMTVTTGSPWSPGPRRAFWRTSGGVRSRLSLRTWTAKHTAAPSWRAAAQRSRRTQPGGHPPGWSSELDVRLSRSSSSPADGPCHGTPSGSRRPRRGPPGPAARSQRPLPRCTPVAGVLRRSRLRASLPSLRSWAPTAYPPALPGALASGPIPPPAPCAWSAAPSWRGAGGLLRSRWPFGVTRRAALSAGFRGCEYWSYWKRQPLALSVLDPARELAWAG
jgi:hypothetical protein